MILERLRLQNFRSYRDAEVCFDRGLFLVLGENGSGKTSILEAISFALFKEFNGSISDLVHAGMESMSVTLEFSAGGHRYRVERTRRKNASGARLQMLDGDGATLLAQGDAEVTREIERCLGIDGQMFLNAIYVRQGEIDQLVTETPAARKKIVGKLLGIESLQKAWENMGRLIDEFRHREELLAREAAGKEEVERRLGEQAGALEEKEERLHELRQLLLRHRAEADQRRDALAEFERREREHRECSVRKSSAQERLGEQRRRLEALRRELAGISAAEKSIRTLAGEVERIAPLERLAEALSEREKLAGVLKALEREIGGLKEASLRTQQALKRELGRCRELLGGEIEGPEEVRAALARAISRLDAAIEERERLRQHAREAIGQKNGRIGELKGDLERLWSAGAGCPLCGAPLSPDRCQELQRAYAGEISGLETELREREKEVERLESELRMARGERDSLQKSVNPEVLERLVNEGNLQYERLLERLEEQKERESDFMTLDSRAGEIATSLDMPDGTGLEEVRRMLKRLRGSEREYQRLMGLCGRRPELEEEIGILEEGMGALEGELAGLEVRLREISYDPEAHGQAKREWERLAAEQQQREREEAGLEREIVLIRERISELEKELDRLSRKAEELERVRAFVLGLHKIRGIFDKDGVQRRLRMIARPLVERHLRTFFAEFNFDYSDVQIDDDYGITLFGPAGETRVPMMSGGERIAVAIAIRLALARALAGGAVPLLLLDEPTVHLDAHRRRDLVQVFRRLESIPQMLIVTHDEEIQEAADTAILVRKSRGISTVEPFTGRDEARAPPI